jgi:hypothetical protein
MVEKGGAKMRIGEKLHCGNADCRAEVDVSATTPANPRCNCGSGLKRHYQKPTVREVAISGNLLANFLGAQPRPEIPREASVHIRDTKAEVKL